ncbi:hypothetical protein M8818_006213 [Zalaria obscura]|uniref:Uncharacterized protein n=1 Tax=Zalaria obscura TaxID=2024903 RepID=A0ACC3S791_9PEZI
MADTKKATDGPLPFEASAWDPATLPDWDTEFVSAEDIEEFAKALSAPDISPSEEDLSNPLRQPTEYITALNDWRPIYQKVKGRQKRNASKKKKAPGRGVDETREGWTYNVLKWPLLLVVFGWLFVLGLSYLATRLYIYFYEQLVTWRGRREQLRLKLRTSTNYEDWVKAAKELDTYLGSDKWKETDEYAYYDSKTIRRVKEHMRKLRARAEKEENGGRDGVGGKRAVDELRSLAEACVKNNFAGFENPRLYSETYYGTKTLVQEYVDEVSAALRALFNSTQLTLEDKRSLSEHLSTNFGRTALCLSGGATFAYYHLGIAKALLDANLLPPIITGTSGGALVAALLATRTDDELKKLLIPALAHRINACSEGFGTWFKRWWTTGARFDSVDWARRCSWFCHGSLTFKEAYERTGRILNVSCVPSDPHSPTILANYLTAPDCVIWSAVLASAAVPGILNPVVLMRKDRDGRLEPYSFGHKWKDGSLRTDIPLKSLNLHFNVNFSIVSQVNPHINLFFFSSRGSVGRPVTHRRGRGWRGGFLGSATEQYLKLDLTKWLKVLRHLELLPRPLGQDWSELWLQKFSGTITIWPKTQMSDFWYILSDPTKERLARMIQAGQQAAFPKLNFVSNRMKIEKVVEEARKAIKPLDAVPTPALATAGMESMLSQEDLQGLLEKAKHNGGMVKTPPLLTPSIADVGGNLRKRHSGTSSPLGGQGDGSTERSSKPESPSWHKRISGFWSSADPSTRSSMETVRPEIAQLRQDSPQRRRGSALSELHNQTRVFWDDSATDHETTDDEGHDVAPFGDHLDGGRNGHHNESEGEHDEVQESREEDQAAADYIEDSGNGKSGSFIG